jgi:nucleoside-diphosphate-sugar epimerase
MRVLVTGGRGFIGRPTVAALRASGHDVVTAGRRPGNSPNDVIVDLLDATDRAALVRGTGADVLIHLAWETRHGSCWTAAENAAWPDASMDLVERFLDAGGRRCVLAGTCAEYDWRTADADLAEGAPCRPETLYGRCKHQLFRRCCGLIEAGASVAWGRVFFLAGPGEDPARFVPAIVRALIAGEEAAMTEGSQVRDILHVNDAGRAFAALAAGTLTGAVNVASGHGVRLVEVAREAEARIGRGRVRIGALPMRPDDPPRLVADVTRLRDEAGFRWRHDWRSALSDAIAYWRKKNA